MKLLQTTQSEFRKLKRTTALYMGLFCIAIIGILVFSSYIMDMRHVHGLLGDPWNIFFERRKPTFQFLYLPVFVILITALVMQIEYRNNTWKQVHGSPQPLLYISLSKLTVILIIVFLFIVVFNILMLGIIVLLDVLYPSLNLEAHRLNLSSWLITIVQSNLSIVAMVVFQFWLSFLIRNFIVVIAIGVGMWISSIFLLFEEKWQYADWIPYSFPLTMMSKAHENITWEICMRSIGFALVFFFAGQIIYGRRMVEGRW